MFTAFFYGCTKTSYCVRCSFSSYYEKVRETQWNWESQWNQHNKRQELDVYEFSINIRTATDWRDKHWRWNWNIISTGKLRMSRKGGKFDALIEFSPFFMRSTATDSQRQWQRIFHKWFSVNHRKCIGWTWTGEMMRFWKRELLRQQENWQIKSISKLKGAEVQILNIFFLVLIRKWHRKLSNFFNFISLCDKLYPINFTVKPGGMKVREQRERRHGDDGKFWAEFSTIFSLENSLQTKCSIGIYAISKHRMPQLLKPCLHRKWLSRNKKKSSDENKTRWNCVIWILIAEVSKGRRRVRWAGKILIILPKGMKNP